MQATMVQTKFAAKTYLALPCFPDAHDRRAENGGRGSQKRNRYALTDARGHMQARPAVQTSKFGPHRRQRCHWHRRRSLCELIGALDFPSPLGVLAVRAWHVELHHRARQNGLLGSSTDHHGDAAVTRSDRHRGAPAGSIDEGLEFEKSGTLVEAGLGEFLGHRKSVHFWHATPIWRRRHAAESMDGLAPEDADRGFRCLGLDLPQLANCRYTFRLLVLREHAKVQHGFCTARECDCHEGMVQDVRLRVSVKFVLVVHRLPSAGVHGDGLRSHDAAHQVEEVAGLLDQGAARVTVEAVPVRHLHEEGEAVLADGDGVQLAQVTTVRLLNQLLNRRHPPVLHTRHEDALPDALGPCAVGVRLEQPLHLEAVLDIGTEGLLAQDVLASRDGLAQHLNVLVVRRADHDGIHLVGSQHVCVLLEDLAVLPPVRRHVRERLGPGVLL
mmetsp:Transcript_168894/g.542900  ORF Transcript_168894/g.542900 Transcript_168894/m.542900 type:complete len:442 (-) Transcript_168894:1260-2585(-)